MAHHRQNHPWLVGALMSTFVGALLGTVVGTLVGPRVGQISLLPSLRTTQQCTEADLYCYLQVRVCASIANEQCLSNANEKFKEAQRPRVQNIRRCCSQCAFFFCDLDFFEQFCSGNLTPQGFFLIHTWTPTKRVVLSKQGILGNSLTLANPLLRTLVRTLLVSVGHTPRTPSRNLDPKPVLETACCFMT